MNSKIHDILVNEFPELVNEVQETDDRIKIVFEGKSVGSFISLIREVCSDICDLITCEYKENEQQIIVSGFLGEIK